MQRFGHVVASSGRGLDILAAVLFGKVLGPAEVDNAPFVQIGLVAHENDVRVLAVGVRLQLGDPVADVEEGELAGQVEHEDEAHGVAEEGGGEGAEALLAGCVP